MLARKYGPTVLGGLLDPIADKVFIAFAYTPFADASGHRFPWWACALMFTREFFITALRSAYEQRNLSLKTSYIAKAKTWTQMQGIGVMLLFPLVENKQILMRIFAAGAASRCSRWRALDRQEEVLARRARDDRLVRRRSSRVHLRRRQYCDPRAIMFGVVAITWISGIDYIMVGWNQLRGRGDFARADGVRLIGSLTLPILLFAVLVTTPTRRAGASSRSSRSSSRSVASTTCSRTTRSRRRRSPGAAACSASACCSAARCC